MNNFFFNLVRDISFILTKKEKRVAVLMLFYTYLNSLLDVASLALLLPLIKLCMDQSISEKNNVLRYIYTSLHFSSATNFTFFILLVTLILFIAKMCLSVFINAAINKYTFKIAYRLTETNFNILYKLGLNEYNAVNSSIFFREIRNTPPVFASSIVLILFQLIAEGFVLILLLVGLAFADVTILAMFIIVIVPFLALLYNATKKRVEQLGKNIWDVDAKTFKFMNESILGFIDIILLNKKSYFITKYMELTDKTNRLNLKKNIYNSIPAKVTEIVAVLGLLIIYVYSSYIVHNSTTTLVTLLTVFAIAS
jgi:ATP-binding cassette, subfamily B, bacterial PglK